MIAFMNAAYEKFWDHISLDLGFLSVLLSRMMIIHSEGL